ncbi:YesL family protein [Gracilibacillus massiliensis]|uniref:YesL family protein n=1 Tax=Gracilibacillus massiliensis TaxID=1564956 RepID=UPI00071E248B|nr:YesL family protein [Gracilibacillus massiliensis]
MKSANTNGFYKFLEWLMWIMYLNLLWIISTLAGLIIFGLFPATMALTTTIREWHVHEEISFHKSFLKAYKHYFIKSNLFGLLFLVAGYILFVDLQWILQNTSTFQFLFLVVLCVVAFIYLITIMYTFPVMAHFDLSIGQVMKHAIVIGVFSPLVTLGIGISLILLYYLWSFIPGLLPVIGVSLPIYIITRLSIMAFERFEVKQQRLLETENNSLKKGEQGHV